MATFVGLKDWANIDICDVVRPSPMSIEVNQLGHAL